MGYVSKLFYSENYKLKVSPVEKSGKQFEPMHTAGLTYTTGNPTDMR